MEAPTFNILILDDDYEDYLIACYMLKQAKDHIFRADWVPDADEALSLITNTRYDAILVDYHLGGRNGIEFMQKVIDRDCSTPLIMYSNCNDPEVSRAAMKAGAAAYLVKAQASPETLEKALQYFITRVDRPATI